MEHTIFCRTQMVLIYGEKRAHFIENHNNNNNIYLLQFGCNPVAVVFFYMYTKLEIGYY